MADNLISLVSQYLGPQKIAGLARTAGVDDAAAHKLVTAAVPAVLAALSAAAAAPGGAQKVSDAVSNADPDLLPKLGTALAGGNAQLLTEGANLLSGVLGGGGLAGLAGALSQHSGAPQGAAQSVIGAVAQVAIGAIGQQDPSNWSDASSIVAMFNGQKNAISAALPADVSKALGASGLLAGLGGAAAAAAQTGTSTVSSATSAAASPPLRSAPAAPASSQPPRSAPAAPRSSGFPMWAIIVIVIVVLVAIYWFMTQGEKPAEPAKSGMLDSPAAVEYALQALPPGRG
jgi:Bacterial protein of unknown function (DUF937)